jgi:uncharacterized protein (TIGR00290 family)
MSSIATCTKPLQVGHQIVVSYAKCMGLPLFRRRICGSTRDQGLKYNVTAGDEVEDMFALLSEVKRQIPSISAVSSGAIASDYQRLRVESVCSRLGLVSLAYLWKQDQTLLLEEMVPWKSSFFYNCMNCHKKHVHSVLLWSLMLTDKKGHCGNNCKGCCTGVETFFPFR